MSFGDLFHKEDRNRIILREVLLRTLMPKGVSEVYISTQLSVFVVKL